MAYPAELFSESILEPNLFLLEKDGKSSYLFGPYHVLPLSVIPEDQQNIMRTAKTLVFEHNPPPPTEDDLIRVGLISATAQDERLYEQLTSIAREVLQNAIRKFCSQHNLTLIPLNRIKLERAIWLCRFAISAGGMEHSLKALFDPSKVFGLELIDSVPFDTTTIDELNEALSSSFGCLKDNPDYPIEVLEPMDDYLSGSSLFNPHYSYWQEQDEELVASRNIKWLPIMLQFHQEKEGPVLFAPGHAHLVGRKGLLCLLQQAGVKISQYDSTTKTFKLFMPNVLFNSLPEQREISIIAEPVKIEIEAILETAVGKDDSKLKESQETVYSLIMEYCAPPPLLFSEIYPKSKEEAEKDSTHSPKASMSNTL